MKTFLTTLLSLCLVGGLYAQDEAVNDTVYMTLDGDYGAFRIFLFQLPSKWSLYVDWGDGMIDYERDMSWPDYIEVAPQHSYDEPGEYQIKLFSESGDLKSKLFHLGLRQREFTSLDVSGCTALQYLDCEDNSLISLDISGCSALDTLDCSGNQLASMDVSGCASLVSLDCGFNQLTSLDVSGCTALQYLDCGGNSLISLDISGCSALETLMCQYNQLTSLDVSQNTALAYLNCCPNQLTSLDVSQNTALVSLGCGFNQLTSLDVSQNTALAYLFCGRNQLTSLDVSGCTALQYLDCEENSLISLDISGCSALDTLNCGYNQLTSLDVSQNVALAYLICDRNQLTSLDLSMNTSLHSLSCNGNRRTVVLDELGRLDLHTLVGFDVEKAKDWYGGTLSGNMLEFQQGSVSYAYATNCVNQGRAFAYFHLIDGSPVSMPIIEPYTSPTSPMEPEITLRTTTPDATIFYTTDGSEPTELSQQYEIPIEVKSSPVTIKAITVKDGKKSRVATATFVFPWLPNEPALSTTTLRVYAQDRTIYLSEPAGEVDVFTTSGRRVYRGVSTAIPVPRPGVYVVTAAGQKYKVGVK